jgi:uncharacterized protein
MHPRALELIARLELSPHPEGGYFREVFRDEALVPHPRHGQPRPAMTYIHFLLPKGTFSAFHRVAQTELWHHVEGDELELIIVRDGPGQSGVERIRLGRGEGCVLVHAVPAGAFQAAVPKGDFCLAGCTVAPGFSFDDFELPSRDELLARLPMHRALVESLTRGPTPA